MNEQKKMQLKIQAVEKTFEASAKNAQLLEDQNAISLFSMDPASDEAKEFFELKKKEYIARARARANSLESTI